MSEPTNSERDALALKCAKHIVKMQEVNGYSDSWYGGESNLAASYIDLRTAFTLATQRAEALSLDVLRCIPADWKPDHAREYGKLGPILAEFIDDHVQRAEAAEAERDETVAGAKYRRELLAALEARCAAAEAERDALRKDACEWRDDDPSEMDGLYSTRCKRLFQLNEPGIEYNGLKFCPYCGGSIVYVAPEVEPDENDDAALAVQPTPEATWLAVDKHGNEVARFHTESAAEAFAGDMQNGCTAVTTLRAQEGE